MLHHGTTLTTTPHHTTPHRTYLAVCVCMCISKCAQD